MVLATKMVLTLQLELNTKDDSHEFLTRFSSQQWVFITWPCITYTGGTVFHLPVSRYTYSGIEVNVVRSSTSRFFNKLLQLKSSREDLVLFLVTCKMYGPVVPGFCEHRLLYCALILQVTSNVIGFLIAAGMHVCHATHSIYLKQNFALLILANTFILNE